MAEELDKRVDLDYANNRIEQILYIIQKVAGGDHSASCGLSGENDIFDSLAMGINMMIDDIKYGVEEIEKERDYTNSIISSMMDALIIMNPDTTIKFINMTTVSMIGYKQDELIGKPVNMIMDEEEILLLGQPGLGDLIKTGFVQSIEKKILSKDGRKIPVLLSGSVVFDKAGKVEEIVWVIKDITKYKQAEESLRDSEKKYYSLFHQSTNSMVLIDLETGKIIDFNKSAYENLGYTKEEFKNFSVSDFEVIETRKEIKTHIEKFIKIGHETFETKHRTKSGEIKDVLVNATVITLNGKFYSQSIFTDITKQKHIEEELERRVEQRTEELEDAKTRAEQANVAKSHFLANVSHELRTPLNAILGISKMLKKYETKNLTEQKEGLELINQSGQRLLSLINDVLDLSKIDAGKKELSYKSFSLNGLISDITAIFDNIKKELEFVIQKNPGVPGFVISDKDKLLQILVNLIGNAIKFTSKGKIVLKIYKNEQKLYFKVSDTGIGISKENIKHVFDEFRQIDGSASRQYGGTGLGLAICKKLVHLMNGEIMIESELNKGTVVWFYVPLKVVETRSETSKGQKEKVKVDDDLKSDKHFPKILIAEDEETGVFTLKMMLEHKYKLIFAKDGQEAIEKYLSEKPDLVLMDIMMPKIDGFAAFDEIKKIATSRFVPIIALTARAMQYEKEKILTHGFDDYISKPIDDELLCRKIEQFLKE